MAACLRLIESNFPALLSLELETGSQIEETGSRQCLAGGSRAVPVAILDTTIYLGSGSRRVVVIRAARHTDGGAGEEAIGGLMIEGWKIGINPPGTPDDEWYAAIAEADVALAAVCKAAETKLEDYVRFTGFLTAEEVKKLALSPGEVRRGRTDKQSQPDD